MSSHPGIWAVVSFAKHLRKQREILNKSGMIGPAFKNFLVEITVIL
jgi:hypothetical protein